jgi:hypothetical protein
MSVRRSRLLCPECNELKSVTDVNASISLECGHTRPEVLPAKGISLEQLNTKAGRKLFPVVWDDERTARRAWFDVH